MWLAFFVPHGRRRTMADGVWRRGRDSPTWAQKPLNLLAKISGLDEVYHLCDSPQGGSQCVY